MEMTEVFDSLKSLQGVLVEKYELEKLIDDAPKQLVYLKGLVEDLKKKYIEKNSEYEEVKSKVDALTEELNKTVEEREKCERDMDNVTAHREYEALEKHITEASEKEKATRDELRVEQDKLASLSSTLKDNEIFIESQKAELDSMNSKMEETVSGYRERLEKLDEKEKSLASTLDDSYQETVHKFHSIIRRNKEGIVAVRNGVCTGCHMILPAQFANEVREGDSIKFCPYCSRILFYEETEESDAEDYSTLDETGSLADFAGDDLDDFGEDDSFSGSDDGSFEDDFDSDKDPDSDSVDDDSDMDDGDFSDDDQDDSEEENS
jgi:hypothetical protein